MLELWLFLRSIVSFIVEHESSSEHDISVYTYLTSFAVPSRFRFSPVSRRFHTCLASCLVHTRHSMNRPFLFRNQNIESVLSYPTTVGIRRFFGKKRVNMSTL